MPMLHIPLSELLREDPRIVDCIGMLGFAVLASKGQLIQNGEKLAAGKLHTGDVYLTEALAREIFELSRAYRQIYRLLQIKHKRLDLDDSEWRIHFAEAMARAMDLDVVRSHEAANKGE